MIADRRVALVTGASRGIGRSIAVALAEAGWAVVVNYRRSADEAKHTLDAVEAAGSPGILVGADIADTLSHQQVLNAARANFGRLDLLVNNAGIAPRRRADLLDMSEASYDEVLNTNLRGPLFLTQAAARWMLELLDAGTIDHADIVNIGSISAYTASVNRGEYCISKAGLGMVTALFAERLADTGINVYEVRPGIIETDMTDAVSETYDALIEEGLTPIRRWGQPADVARAVVAIAEGYLPFSTGEVINVDGGFHLRRL